MKGHVARKRFGQNFLVDSGIISTPKAADAMPVWRMSIFMFSALN